MPWWVIGDGSFPRATIGDDVDVVVELITGTSSLINEPLAAFAVPAYGRGPEQRRDGGFRWRHLLYGDGWSAGWWSAEPCSGRVELNGYLVAEIRGDDDGPTAVSGRVSAMHAVQIRLDPTDGGGRREVSGTEELIAVDGVPTELEPWSVPDDGRVHRAVTSVLVDLDLGDPPVERPAFIGGTIDICGDVVWVMHRSAPTLLRIDARCHPPTVVEFLLPLTIESPHGEWTRRVHATPDGCWIVSVHDIHRVVDTGDDAVTVARICVDGGQPSVLHQDRLYVFGSTGGALASDRRHGVVRRQADAVPVQVCDTATHSLRPVTDRATVFEIRRHYRRPDRASDADGGQWGAGNGGVVRKTAGDWRPLDVSEPVAGTVTRVQPRPEDDPATATLLAEITVEVPRPDPVDDEGPAPTTPSEDQ
ncbi:hypothetical protein HQ325_17025 [Rhodococcus sp. BP-349]|uniref:hypothetical protein n=1 Tax=unclassified Rhodococcus (in: high G+C Gram-positive bacteria) TaxID=192944 RepID=UPI001C9ABBB0|nr:MULTISPECIES: hypothetical protein [unclassified Rhodococcus (in: high G+C Gram-positive bacteria)]MBY6540380.1 hypothetical protein [Rhodococcus sp. BP-363]MBY6545595.1 hypothetical protein [Rhodococcus sp. BP-369]MBY6564825.1 hypothetical protein [Rhodococcus sp. BP-370]MBY6578239.1 hypothetical protein [Rhodococcus sp. BP-364]MBY6587540.1 hypothetical protein [Rhodococcus sp. BP-358]